MAADRRIVYCLLCEKPHENLSSHLKKACMKDNTEEERNAELTKAKISQKEWTRVGRRWEYHEVDSLMNEEDPLRALIDRLKSKGFFIVKDPSESSPAEQRQLLQDVTPWMRSMVAKLKTGVNVATNYTTQFRYFCMGVLSVVYNKSLKSIETFKTAGWVDRQQTSSGVTIQFSDNSVACTLRKEEEEWFELYFTKIRPLALLRQDEYMDDEGCFFLGQNGGPIANTKTDLQRLWKFCEQKTQSSEPIPEDTQTASGSCEQTTQSSEPIPEDTQTASGSCEQTTQSSEPIPEDTQVAGESFEYNSS
ncbi:uncharacterized protein LOC121699744 [Alosa sapidissima]|uniref:uncharacterized protein LOC121699744 n=1 Tax=Alosa sapidissima TaxID=34773 RepID=UPI001C0A447C|nr:uncharacterized protein LOC121699744 [Alosa sapidissima]